MKIKKEQGINVEQPEKEKNEGPELFNDLIWVWNGFLALSNSRSVGMAGPLHITYSEINNYCELYSIKGYIKKSDFADHVRLLDNLWIEDYYEKEKKKRAAEDRKKNNK